MYLWRDEASSLNHDNVDDDDDLPVGLKPVDGSQFQPGDIIWIHYQTYPFWPALVRNQFCAPCCHCRTTDVNSRMKGFWMHVDGGDGMALEKTKSSSVNASGRLSVLGIWRLKHHEMWQFRWQNIIVEEGKYRSTAWQRSAYQCVQSEGRSEWRLYGVIILLRRASTQAKLLMTRCCRGFQLPSSFGFTYYLYTNDSRFAVSVKKRWILNPSTVLSNWQHPIFFLHLLSVTVDDAVILAINDAVGWQPSALVDTELRAAIGHRGEWSNVGSVVRVLCEMMVAKDELNFMV